jgi:outer membrane receptor protein involved in Fe transport
MPFKRRIPLAGIFAALLLPVFGGPGFAAEDPAAPHTLPTITVTAQKREENVQEIPSSVGVVSEQTIEEKNIREVRDLSHMAPNLNITTSGGSGTYSYFGIRGRTNSNSDIDPTVTLAPTSRNRAKTGVERSPSRIRYTPVIVIQISPLLTAAMATR